MLTFLHFIRNLDAVEEPPVPRYYWGAEAVQVKRYFLNFKQIARNLFIRHTKRSVEHVDQVSGFMVNLMC